MASTSIIEDIRRANSVGCECGVCASCISDEDYYNIVRTHSYLSCQCKICSDYRINIEMDITTSVKCRCNVCYELFKKNLDPRVKVFLRRANNCQCDCGVCATCMSEITYFQTVSDHIEFVKTCDCKVCQSYRGYHERYNWTL
jgi:hypothetical protein